MTTDEAWEGTTRGFDSLMAGMLGGGVDPGKNLLGALGAGLKSQQAARAQFDHTEMTKAAADEQMKQKAFEGQEKRLLDFEQKMFARGSEVLPNGNRLFKAGDRAYEIVPDQAAPEGYRMREVVSSGKTILGANEKLNYARQIALEEMKQRDMSGMSGADQESFIARRTRELMNMPDSVLMGMPTATMPPNATVNAAQPGGAHLQPQGGLPSEVATAKAGPNTDFEIDMSRYSPQDRETVRRLLARVDGKENLSPELEKNTLQQLIGINNKYQAVPQTSRPLPDQLTPSPTFTGQSVNPPVKDNPALKARETQLSGVESNLNDYEKALVEKTDRGNAMLRNIGKLSTEASEANFGPTAGFKTQAMKWATDLGVPLTPEETSAMTANQVIGKIALQLATVGAKDITSRPTQLEFQKLLDEGVPSTGMTKEAFLQILKMFQEGAQKDQGQLQDFMQWKHGRTPGSSQGDFSDYWALKQNDPRYSGLSVKDVFETAKARNMSFNDVINKLRERK
jgi:hypothetical protein